MDSRIRALKGLGLYSVHEEERSEETLGGVLYCVHQGNGKRECCIQIRSCTIQPSHAIVDHPRYTKPSICHCVSRLRLQGQASSDSSRGESCRWACQHRLEDSSMLGLGQVLK